MSQPFDWGPADCVSAACDVFARLWGVDPLAPWRGYASRAGAVAILRDLGSLDALAEAMARRCSLSPGHATGGLALSRGPGPRSMLVCITPGLWAGKSRHGFAILKDAGKGWHA